MTITIPHMHTPLLLLHGVPDTPAVWSPLIHALGPSRSRIETPALPGFTAPTPRNFTATKEAYTDWLLDQISALHAENGPIDIVGHDWGALLTLRAASLAPEKIRSWAVSGAVMHPDYKGHRLAKIWATPILGELSMVLAKPAALEASLIKNGLPAAIASIEAEHWTPSMRKCILKLYRSADALRFSDQWLSDLIALPADGLVLWGKNDPYVDLSFAADFAKGRAVQCHVEDQSGHWMIAERPEFAASHLRAFWDALN